MDTESGVYLGVWTNWSRGYILGATLTLNRFNATLLIAFVSFFVGFVGTRFWRIICLILHRYYSRPDEFQDGLYHHRQLILRNSESADSSFLSLIRLSHAWRGLVDNRLSRTLPLIFLSAFTFLGFITASGFTSLVSTGIGTDVLLDGVNCGVMYPMSTGTESWNVLVPYESDRVSDAANYAQQCYSPNSYSVFDCNRFVVTQLPTTINYTASCPFQNDKGICRSDTGNLVLETTMDSTEHLGVNTPEDERIQIKARLHCSPLSTQGRSGSVEIKNISVTRYYYGPMTNGPVDNATTVDFTYQKESIASQYATPIRPLVLAKNFIVTYIKFLRYQLSKTRVIFTNIDFLNP
jgi:hypothetical protein